MGMSVVARGLGSSGCDMKELFGSAEEPGQNLLLRSGNGLNPGVSVKPVESNVATELRPHPIERSLLCQAGADGCGGFATVFGEPGNFLREFLLRRVDTLCRGDAVQNQFGLHIFDGAVALA